MHTFISLAKSYLRAPGDTPAQKTGLVRGCLALFDHMREENVAPTVEFFNCVLAVCVRHGRPTDSLRLYNQMRASGYVCVCVRARVRVCTVGPWTEGVHCSPLLLTAPDCS